VNSSFASNTASSNGGGIRASRAAVFLRDVEMSSNAAALFGGAVSIDGGLLLGEGITLASNKAGLGIQR
jgi:predicted outer membrane repeat protein